jgi:hypothetical protein
VTVARPLATAADIRRHVGVKLAGYELRPEVAARMLAALDAGAPPDWPALEYAATWPPPPPVVYHTAPATARAAIGRRGLAPCQPGQGGNWAPRPGTLCVALQAGQPPGVYVCPEPDTRGVWAHWPAWDVWAVARGGLPWRPDRLNLGCWSLAVAVPPALVRWHGTYGART